MDTHTRYTHTHTPWYTYIHIRINKDKLMVFERREVWGESHTF